MVGGWSTTHTLLVTSGAILVWIVIVVVLFCRWCKRRNKSTKKKGPRNNSDEEKIIGAFKETKSKIMRIVQIWGGGGMKHMYNIFHGKD